ncbi:PD-(D/E)XK motif protein [Streptomyces sp. TR06-5]|uniref:PD-(D/E)XK motif protein n=1 Tax=Streptomyces sp. TR06-5 TaxID=3385976 RepID=UPI0039A191C5
MTEEEARALLEEQWGRLARTPVPEARKVRAVELQGFRRRNNLGITVAVDTDGRRHLLVPVTSRTSVRSELDGPVLKLRKRSLEDAETFRWYADLGCEAPDFDDLFTRLCSDVLLATEANPGQPLKTLYRVLDRWKDLFRSDRPPLGPDQLVGIFGELTVLARLLTKDPSAHRLWLGSEGHRHDFSSRDRAVEVKAGTHTEGRRPRIHGLDQLEAPPRGTLSLAWIRLSRTPAGAGTSVPELVDRVLEACDDDTALLRRLAQLGYSPTDTAHYRNHCFTVAEERWYHVDANFPGLTGRHLREAGIPVSVVDVEYSIDLSGELPAPMSPDEIDHTVDSMLQEPQ